MNLYFENKKNHTQKKMQLHKSATIKNSICNGNVIRLGAIYKSAVK